MSHEPRTDEPVAGPHPIVALGFPSPIRLGALKTVAHLFGPTRRRVGLYALVFEQGDVYIGQSTEVVRRFAQHRRVHDDIVAFSFLPVSLVDLDSRERDLIHEAERLRIPIRNVVHASDVVGDTDLDLLVPAATLDAWLLNPEGVRCEADSMRVALPALSEGHARRSGARFRRFIGRPEAGAAVALLGRYLRGCVPLPRTTEYSFWAVSCMPSTNAATWPRLLCVSAAVMEVFAVGVFANASHAHELWSFVVVASDVLWSCCNGKARLLEKHPNVETWSRHYRDGGQYQLTLTCRQASSMMALLGDPCVRRAAGALCLRLMRKRATIFSRFHSPHLADYALTGSLPAEVGDLLVPALEDSLGR